MPRSTAAAPSGFVLRLNPDFSIDTTFGSQGVASFSYGEFYYSLALQPDGKILIAGGEGPNAGGQHPPINRGRCQDAHHGER